MHVTLVDAKVCYGASQHALQTYLASKAIPDVYTPGPGARAVVQMSDAQFVRFKNAGKQHATDPMNVKFAGAVSRVRPDRTGNAALEKWDVAAYGDLTGRAGPWGGGPHTNRDHVTAHSSNVMRWNNGLYPLHAHSQAELKNVAPAITVSGRHHREASWTYGGRTKTIVVGTTETRMEYGAFHPDASVRLEFDAMLGWKADPNNHSSGNPTIRVEMVGAYAYLYKVLVNDGVTTASKQTDDLVLHYLNVAVLNDDGVVRK
ncbi:MAG TPA: hypothetical protein VF041_19380 [Gemmatimonadaceae bacterium]